MLSIKFDRIKKKEQKKVKTREQQLYELGREFALQILEDLARNDESGILTEILRTRRRDFPQSKAIRWKKSNSTQKELTT